MGISPPSPALVGFGLGGTCLDKPNMLLPLNLAGGIVAVGLLQIYPPSAIVGPHLTKGYGVTTGATTFLG